MKGGGRDLSNTLGLVDDLQCELFARGPEQKRKNKGVIRVEHKNITDAATVPSGELFHLTEPVKCSHWGPGARTQQNPSNVGVSGAAAEGLGLKQTGTLTVQQNQSSLLFL